jgi:putative flippase GtrA
MWQEQKQKLFDWSIIKFLIVGVLNTLSGLSVIYFLKFFLNCNDITANALGYSCGLILGFYLNSQWSFSFKGNFKHAALRFIFVVAVAYTANIVIVLFGISLFEINSYFSQLLGIFPYTILTYLGMRLFVFPTSKCGSS